MRAIITATPCNGISLPLNHLAATVETSTDLPADALGECLAEAVNNAWKSGIDPALEPFLVIVTFR